MAIDQCQEVRGVWGSSSRITETRRGEGHMAPKKKKVEYKSMITRKIRDKRVS